MHPEPPLSYVNVALEFAMWAFMTAGERVQVAKHTIQTRERARLELWKCRRHLELDLGGGVANPSAVLPPVYAHTLPGTCMPGPDRPSDARAGSHCTASPLRPGSCGDTESAWMAEDRQRCVRSILETNARHLARVGRMMDG